MVDNNTIILKAYTLIRRKAKHFENYSNEEVGAYVRGVVDLQAELHDFYEKEDLVLEDEEQR